MADNIITPATGSGDATPVVATDDVSGVHFQKVKLAVGTADSSSMIPSDATAGLKVDLGADNDVSIITGQAGIAGGTGVDGATVPRVTLATNVALPAGTNNIGDVDVLTIAAGTNAIGNVGIIPRTTGGFTTYHLVSAATTNATVVKASAGQLFGWFIYNNATTMRKLAFHNSASAPTAGASIFFTINIPGSSAANVMTETGIVFSAGIAFTTVQDVTDAGSTAVALSDLTINLWYA